MKNYSLKCNILGCDISQSMLNQSENKNMSTFNYDLKQVLPIKFNSIDLFISVSTLQWLFFDKNDI